MAAAAEQSPPRAPAPPRITITGLTLPDPTFQIRPTKKNSEPWFEEGKPCVYLKGESRRCDPGARRSPRTPPTRARVPGRKWQLTVTRGAADVSLKRCELELRASDDQLVGKIDSADVRGYKDSRAWKIDLERYKAAMKSVGKK
jgi:hypothetical protein